MVGSDSQYLRLSVIAQYLQFLANRLHPRIQESSAVTKKMVRLIKENRPKKDNRCLTDREDNYLSVEVLEAISEALEPGSENNPVERTFVYTAATRAQVQIIFVGDIEAVEEAIALPPKAFSW